MRDLRRDVVNVEFPLKTPGSGDAVESRDQLIAQLDKHLLPRLRELSSPAVVIVAGSTGAGKSTMFNSILGAEISPAGVLRPTTREPVLAYNPADADVLRRSPATTMSRVVDHPGVPRGTALLDAPDLDSFVAENRETAALLLEAADLWLFVTTAARYGDALPWATLSRAVERGVAVAMVLNRVPRENLATIRADLLNRLREHGMQTVPLFVIPDAGPHEGLLDRTEVAPIERWLNMLAGPERSRTVIIRTLKGALKALPNWVADLSESLAEQAAAAERIRDTVRDVMPRPLAAVRASVAAGSAARGPLEARWTQLVADQRVDRVLVRGGVVRSTRRRGRSRQRALEPLREEVRKAVTTTLIAGAAAAARALRDALAGDNAPAGARALVPDAESQSRTREQAARVAAQEWARPAEEFAAQCAQPDAGDVAHGAVKAFGVPGIAAMLLVAGAGNADAARLVDTVLPQVGHAQVERLRTTLTEAAVALTRAEAEPVTQALNTPELAPDAAVGLRLRLAELRRLM